MLGEKIKYLAEPGLENIKNHTRIFEKFIL